MPLIFKQGEVTCDFCPKDGAKRVEVEFKPCRVGEKIVEVVFPQSGWRIYSNGLAACENCADAKGAYVEGS